MAPWLLRGQGAMPLALRLSVGLGLNSAKELDVETTE
jgi:hypothetical protein